MIYYDIYYIVHVRYLLIVSRRANAIILYDIILSGVFFLLLYLIRVDFTNSSVPKQQYL